MNHPSSSRLFLIDTETCAKRLEIIIIIIVKLNRFKECVLKRGKWGLVEYRFGCIYLSRVIAKAKAILFFTQY